MKRSQNEVGEWFTKAKQDWSALIKESGKSEANFICTESVATQILYAFQQTRNELLKHGMRCEELVPGLVIEDKK